MSLNRYTSRWWQVFFLSFNYSLSRFVQNHSQQIQSCALLKFYKETLCIVIKHQKWFPNLPEHCIFESLICLIHPVKGSVYSLKVILHSLLGVKVHSKYMSSGKPLANIPIQFVLWSCFKYIFITFKVLYSLPMSWYPELGVFNKWDIHDVRCCGVLAVICLIKCIITSSNILI